MPSGARGERTAGKCPYPVHAALISRQGLLIT